jgi:hypothetical protein
MFVGVLRGSAIAALSALVLVASASAATDSTIAPAQSTSLPVGHGEYFYVASSAGEVPIGSISWIEGQDLAVTAPGGSNQAISIGHSSSHSGSFSTASARTAITGLGLDGYDVVQTFSAQHSKVAHKATRTPTKAIKGAAVTLPFLTASANELVLVAAGGQGTGTLELSGVEATALQNATYGSSGPGAIASAALYTAQLPKGKHKLKLRSMTYAPNPGTSVGVVAYVLAPAPAPSVGSVSPSSGPEVGGTPVLIKGTDLDGATAVKFGGSEAASFKVASPTSIEAVSPAGSGAVDVTVVGPNGESTVTTSDQFTYLAPHPVDAYSNYGPATLGHAMCRGNPGRPESMPGGSATQTFTVPGGVASLSSALIQIDPDSSVTAHLTLNVNGSARATTDAAAAGDTHFSWPAVAVSPGDQVSLTISFTATFGKIITIYGAAEVAGTLSYSNSCSDGAGSTQAGLRAIVSGTST